MKQFELRREVVLHGTPEQVFEAVTTGAPGWMFPTGVEAGPDGGAPDVPGLTWQPPHLFAARMEGENGWFNALEYAIEGRDGGTALLRYVHAGMFTDNWDDQYDATNKHTDFYLHSLDQYVRYFPGRPVTYIAVQGPKESSTPEALGALKGALGLGDASAVGDRVVLTVPGLEPVEAELDYLTENFIGLRSSDALYRFYGRNAFGSTVDAAHHLFAPGADGTKATEAWQTWLNGLYA